MHTNILSMYFTCSVYNVVLFVSLDLTALCILHSLSFSLLHSFFHAPDLKYFVHIFLHFHIKNVSFMAFVMWLLLPECLFIALINCRLYNLNVCRTKHL